MTGCSQTPTVISFKQDKLDIKGEVPLDKCDWPELSEANLNGQHVIVMTDDEFRKQRACQVTEQKNYDIAKLNAESVDEAVLAFNQLIDKAQLHNNYAQNELDREHDKLKNEVIENWTLKGVLAGVLIVLAL